ncbi:MAG: methyltransferase domain-containing protein [Alphaproteobacteria bacterium]|nr:methyltransferase domain-containing protein [Alphaproteobacteria bacterium]
MSGNNDRETFRACTDALLRPCDGAWVLSNPRTRRHIELDAAAIAAFTQHAAGASEELWQEALNGAQGHDRTAPTGESGLWGDPTGLAPCDGSAVSGDALFALLRRHLFVLQDGANEYENFLAPQTSPLDDAHLGTFHQRVGQTLLRHRVRERWRWWHNQKFVDDGTAIQAAPYKLVQENFFDRYFANADIAGERILDFACGNGYFAAKLARLGANVVGIDTSEPLIASAQRNYGAAAEFVHVADPQAGLDWLAQQEPDSFDRIYMSDILLLLLTPEDGKPDPDNVTCLLSALARLLRVGGQMHMMEPNGTTWLAGRYGGEAGRNYVIVPEYRRPVFNVAPTLDRVMELVGAAGFVLADYRHPEISDDSSSDPALSAYANEFPLWDFLTFRRWPDDGSSLGDIRAHA